MNSGLVPVLLDRQEAMWLRQLVVNYKNFTKPPDSVDADDVFQTLSSAVWANYEKSEREAPVSGLVRPDGAPMDPPQVDPSKCTESHKS